ncbi:MAG: HEAT repeat domain-containing protein [Gemmatimonadota bacterium]
MTRTSLFRAASLALPLALAAGCVPDKGRPDFEALAYREIVRAEDARPAGGSALETLIAATRSPSAWSRAAGVRALGRLERTAMVDHIAPILDDPAADVRAEAANALAQAVHGGSGRAVLPLLLARLGSEQDPRVKGVLARSLGRLDLDGAEPTRVAHALVALTFDPAGSVAPAEQVVGVVLGMESLTRRGGGAQSDTTLTHRLRDLVRYASTEASSEPNPDRIRALALTALGHARAVAISDLETGLQDPAPSVRRAAAANLGLLEPSIRRDLIRLALRDPADAVRLEAVRLLARGPRDEVGCEALLAAARTAGLPHTRLAAIDALDRPCPGLSEQADVLVPLAASLPQGTSPDWHTAAHALVALAGLSPDRALRLLPGFVGHPSPFVRTYAVQAAGRIGDVSALRGLLDDPHANVRTAAAQQLSLLEGRGADGALLEALSDAEDAQLVLTLAGLLDGTSRRDEAADVALGALERLSEARLQTLRDPRLALLDLVAKVGSAERLSRVEPFLRDYDAPVAERAAEVLFAWTGQHYLAAPRRRVRLPYPALTDLRALERSTIRLHMDRGGVIDILLLPRVAPTNALRFRNLVREGSLDGLTFHRVVGNFVIQGGSPGANEYAGHGAHTRDEVGLRVQWEGTVGLSTRGRDTGDGQLYINLVDNVRLDHDYTIFGRVVDGMEVVHRVMEGDVIRRAEVLSTP